MDSPALLFIAFVGRTPCLFLCMRACMRALLRDTFLYWCLTSCFCNLILWHLKSCLGVSFFLFFLSLFWEQEKHVCFPQTSVQFLCCFKNTPFHFQTTCSLCKWNLLTKIQPVLDILQVLSRQRHEILWFKSVANVCIVSTRAGMQHVLSLLSRHLLDQLVSMSLRRDSQYPMGGSRFGSWRSSYFSAFSSGIYKVGAVASV